MKVYKTKCGYFYKEYKNGKKIRISKEKYLKLKNSKIKKTQKRNYSKKQKGGVITTGNAIRRVFNHTTRSKMSETHKFNINKIQNVLLPHRKNTNINRKINKSFRNSVSKDMKCKVCNEEIIKSLFNKIKYYSYKRCPYCGHNTHNQCFNDKTYELFGSKDLTAKRKVQVCKLCASFLDEYYKVVNKDMPNGYTKQNLDIVLRFESVFSNIDNFNNIVLVDASGIYLKEKQPEMAGKSAGSLYKFLGVNKIKDENNNTFKNLTMGKVVKTTYTKNENQIDVIHAYSYDFRTSTYSSMNKAQCIKELSKVYKKVFDKFIETNKKTLHLLPLSGGLFAGIHKSNMKTITFQAIQEAYQNIIKLNKYSTLSQKTIILCLYSLNEFSTYFSTGFYKLNESSLESSLDSSLDSSLSLENLFIEDLTNNTNTKIEKYSKKNLRELSVQSSTYTTQLVESKNSEVIELTFEHCNTYNDFIIEYAAIMNALSQFKEKISEYEFILTMKKLRFKMNSRRLNLCRQAFLKHFYLMIPFHLRFKKYINIENPIINPTNITQYLEFNQAKLCKQLQIQLIRHREGSVGIAKLLHTLFLDNYRIALLIAGNSGCPGGNFGKNLGSNFIKNSGEISRGQHPLQEESVIQQWLENEQKMSRVSGGDILNHTIRGQWGLFDLDLDASNTDYNTIQGINYKNAGAKDYRTSWVCENCCLDSSTNLKCDLVFVAGPNIDGKGLLCGSMVRTLNEKMKRDIKNRGGSYDNIKKVKLTFENKLLKIDEKEESSFITGIKEAIYAGLYAAYKTGCFIVLVPYISGGIYYSNKPDKQDKLKKLYPIILKSVLDFEIPNTDKTFREHFAHIILCDIITLKEYALEPKNVDFKNALYIERLYTNANSNHKLNSNNNLNIEEASLLRDMNGSSNELNKLFAENFK